MDGMDGGGRDGRTETRSGGLQARVSFEDDDSRDVMTRSEPGALEHAGSALSLLATPAHRKDASAAKSLGSYSERPPDSRAASARRTKKKKGPVDTPDAATPDSLSAIAPSASAAGAMMDLAIPLTFEEMDVRSARSTPSAAAATFREVLVSCSCDFESAAEKVSTELLLVEGVGCQPIPAACALGVMAQACAWLNTMLGKDERVLDQMATEALQGIGFSLCVLSCKVEQEQGCQRGDELEDQRKELMERSVELLGACLRRWSWASVEEGGERSAHKRARAAALSDRLSIAAASMQALDKCARDASNASLWMAIMKLALHAVLCEQLPEVQAEGMKLLKSLFASNAEQRGAVLEEIFFLLDDDRVGRRAKKFKGFRVPGSSGIYMQPVNAALLLALQSIPASSSSAADAQDLHHVTTMANYLFDMFEKRFGERASLKGKDVKDELKDAASRSFLMDLVDDVLAVLGLPCFPVAEEVLNILLLRCGDLVGRSSQRISVPHRALMVDIVSASFLGLVKYKHKIFDDKSHDAALGPELVKDLEVQQGRFCATFGEFSKGTIAAPMKLARDEPGAEDLVQEECARQVLLNYLSSRESFARLSAVCHDAFVYLLLRWSEPGVQEDQAESSVEDAGAQQFWGAQLYCALQTQLDCVTSCVSAHQMAEQRVELLTKKLTLKSALFCKIPQRLRIFLHHLMRDNDGRGSEKAKVLRMVASLAALQPDLLERGFLRRVAEDFLLAGDANVRAAAVELLSSVVLGKVRQSSDDSQSQETFDALTARKADVSVKVRHAVAACLQEVASLTRPQEPLLGEAHYAQLVGAHVYKHVDGMLLTGRVVGFDKSSRVHMVEYGSPDGASSSQGECEAVGFDCLKTSLVLTTDAEDASVGDPARGFQVGRRFVVACSNLCSLLLSEEESIWKFVHSALLELWFTGTELPPVNACLEEIIATVNSDAFRPQNGDHGPNTAWLERLLDQLPEEASGRCQQYVDVLFCKLSAVENISPVHSPGAGRPSCFNDFDTRAKMLLPLLLTLKPLARKVPQYAFPHLGKIMPVLATMEVSSSHLCVLRMLQDLLCSVACCHRDLADEEARRVVLELQQAKSQRLQAKGKNQALDAKISDLGQQLARCAEPSLPLALEAALVRSFQQGAFKLADAHRWQSFEDISRTTRALCAVVRCNRTPMSVAFLFKVFSQYVSVLRSFIEAPTDERAAWIPRALCVAGNIVRYFEFESVQDVALVTEALHAKKNFLVMAVAHFPNNARESIKRATLHALGSVFVREPKLMLNRTVVKLMKDCLAPKEANGSQLQVLKNLHDHFLQEEAELVALTAAAPQQDAAVELVSDTSTSLIQQFHTLILESSLSPALKIRDQAVQLMRVILHRGLTASYLLIPYLLAQQCKTDATSNEALRVLGMIHQKEPSRLTPQALWDGVEKGFRMLQRQAASEPASLPRLSDLNVEAFAGAFRLVASNDKEKASKSVRSFLAMAIKSFDQLEHVPGSKKEGTLGFKHFVAQLLAQLPYHSMDSVLMLIKLIQNCSSALGGSCMEGLGRFLAASREPGDDGPDCSGLARWIREAQCLSVLVQLDSFLRRVYGIKHERLRKFLADSHTLDKTPVKDAVMSDRPAFRISIHFDASVADDAAWLTQEATSELRRQYKSLQDLLRGSFVVDGVEMLDDDDTEPVKSKVKQPKARSKDLKKEQATEDEDEDQTMDQGGGSGSGHVQKRDKRRVTCARTASSRAKRARSEIDSGSSETETPAKPAGSEKGPKASAKNCKGKSRKKG